MATEVFANNFSTTLTANVAPGDATIAVLTAAPTALQAPGATFRVLVDQEYMLVTGGAATTTWNVTRAMEGTSAAAHNSGVIVSHVLTASALGNAVAPSGALEGVSLWGFGNSYLWQNFSPSFCQRRYFDRISSQIRSGSANNGGISGFMAPDVANYMHGTFTATTNHGTATGTWTPAATTRGVVILDLVRNDAGWDGVGTTKTRAGFVNALDSIIRLVRSQSLLQDTNGAFVYTGTWTAQTGNTGIPGTTAHHTVTPGDKVTITTPVGTDFDLVSLGFDVSAGAAFTVTVDGVDITATLAAAGYPTTANNQCLSTKFWVPANNWVPLSIPLRGLSNAAHTVVLTHAGAASSILYACRLLTPSPTPPSVIIIKANQLGSFGYNTTYAGNGSFATDQIYNGLIDSVVARFPSDGSIVTFDPNAYGWNPSTMICSGDAQQLHHNDLGAACYAGGAMAVLNALPMRNGLVVL